MNNSYKSIYLIRHGENEISLGNPQLTDRGIVQAKSIRFQKGEIDGIVASPTRRTVETAMVIANTLGVSYHTNDLLKERLDFLDVPDSGYTNFKKRCVFSSNNRHYVLPNGESSYSSGLRLEYFVTYIANIANNGVVLVTHQGIIADYLRNKFSSDYLDSKLHTFTTLREDSIANCSVTRVDVKGDDHILQYIGSTEHLDNI